jgi:putative ABC transport system permease protein
VAEGRERKHRHRAAFVCLAVLIACGVGTFVGLRGTVHDLDDSLANFYDDSQFADLVVVGGETDAFAADAAHVSGVSETATRTTTTLSVWIGGGRTKVQGTVIGAPASAPPIDALSITAGHTFAGDTSANVAVVEQHTADDLGVAPGDSLQALGIGSVAELAVTGIGVSPEYLLPAQSQQQVVTTPGSFAVLYVPETVAQTLGGPAGIGQVLVRYDPDADRDALDQRLTRLARRHQAALVVPRSQQPSNAVIGEEQTGFDEASVVVPGLVLLLAVAVGAMASARERDARTRRRRIAVATCSGAVFGIALGLIAARIGGPKLADSVALPSYVTSANVGVAVLGLVLAVVTGLLALAVGALDRNNRGQPAGASPAIVTAIATAIAVACVVAPAGVVDSAEATLDAAADLERADSQVVFVTAVTPADLGQLRAIDGMAAAEPVPSANIVIGHRDRRYATSLEAFRAGTSMQRFETPDGAPMTLPAHGVLLPESLGAILDAHRGDDVDITLPGAGVPTLHLPIAAFTSDTLGNLVFLRISVLRAALGADADAFAGGLFDTATIRFTAEADSARMATEVQALPDVVVYVPVQADLNSVASARPIFAAITDALLAIGALVALLGIGSAVIVHVHARRRRGASTVVLEVLAAAVIGIVVGAVLGTIGANRLVDALDSDLIHLVREIDTSTYLLAAAAVLVATVLVLVVGLVTDRSTTEPRTSAE